MNPATQFVEAGRGTSPMRRYVTDHGQGVAKQDTEHVMVAGRQVAVSIDVTAEERTLIKQGIKATKPAAQRCFANALDMWQYDHRFAYTEGFAVLDDLDVGGIDHAWCLLDDEKLVDVTEPLDHYHGASISDPDVLERYTGSEFINDGIIGNHHNQHEFLRERGYTKYE